jgi:hypothetical protein
MTFLLAIKIIFNFNFKALGLIGEFNNEIKDCLIWAIHFECDPSVRVEACHSLILLAPIKLVKNDQKLIDVLTERQLTEEEPLVRKYLRFKL